MVVRQFASRWTPLLLRQLTSSVLPATLNCSCRCFSAQVQESKEETKAVSEATKMEPSISVASNSQISSTLNHNALVVTRDIEWGTVLLGFEQANKYTVFDEDGEKVALIAEDITGFGNILGRQLLRTRRSFTATVFNADGSQVIFRIRRPMYLINSSMFVENAVGDLIGEIHHRWHLWKRNYDLYLDQKQFARIDGSFLAWEFELKNQNGGTLALIDRNFQGFGKELFTDAGKYVIHFGQSPSSAAEVATETIKSRTEKRDLQPVTALAKLRTGVKVIPTYTGNQLVVSKSLNLSQRMISLACAMTIDYDYFSIHSNRTGFLAPPIIMPIPGGGESTAPVAEDPSSSEASAVDQAEEGVLGDDETWAPDESELLGDGDDGGGLSGLFENIKDVLGDSWE